MTERLTRRRFARLAVAGGVAASSIGMVTAPFAKTIFARSAEPVLIGVRPAALTTDGPEAPEVNQTEPPPSSAASANPRAVQLQFESIDLQTGRVRSARNTGLLTDGRSAALQTNDLITGSAALGDGSVVVALTQAVRGTPQLDSTRLVRSAATSTSVTIAGLRPDQLLADLLLANDGSIMGLVVKRNGSAPADLVTLRLDTGQAQIVDRLNSPGYWRMNTLAQSPQGAFYATAINRAGETHLVQLDIGHGRTSVIAPLTLAGSAWNNGLQNLVYTSSGDVFAFGAMRYETTNTLYSVNPRTGEMTRLYDVDAVSIATAPA